MSDMETYLENLQREFEKLNISALKDMFDKFSDDIVDFLNDNSFLIEHLTDGVEKIHDVIGRNIKLHLLYDSNWMSWSQAVIMICSDVKQDDLVRIYKEWYHKMPPKAANLIRFEFSS